MSSFSVVHVYAGDHILDRGVFFDPNDAEKYAQQQVREKVWRIGDHVYFGDVDVRVYNLDHRVTSDEPY